MGRRRVELAGWFIAVGAVAATLVAAPIVLGLAATLMLAALWCMKLDREEYAVQLLGSDSPAVNL